MQNEEDWAAALSQVKRQLSLTLSPCQVGRSAPPDARQPRLVLGAFYIHGDRRGPLLYTPNYEASPLKVRRLNVETALFDRIFPGAPIAGMGSQLEPRILMMCN